jgi:hypothetical protein
MRDSNNIQRRGHCQLCGREQAVKNGAMAHHGYTVEHGYFSGVCQGNQYEPLQVSRTMADKVIADVTKQCDEMLVRIAGLEAGTVKPEKANGTAYVLKHGVRRYELVPFDQANEYAQVLAVRSEVGQLEHRERSGRAFVAFLAGVADARHGQPLREVERTAGPAPILPGERRKLPSGKDARARYTDRGRVYWVREPDGFRGWSGTQSWRRFEVSSSAPPADAQAE